MIKTNNIQISVVIPTYNKLDRLKVILFCLGKQNLSKEQYEVIVINDGSSDGTQEFLDSLNVDYTLKITHQKNYGQAIARNNGISLSEGSIIVFLDDDLIIPANFLELHLREHRNSNDKIILGRIYRINSSDFNNVSQNIFSNYYSIFPVLNNYIKKDLYLDMVDTVFKKNLSSITWICFTGGNSSVNKNLLLKVGLFDTNFFRWGPEDIELGYRLFTAKAIFEYLPDIYNFHLDIIKTRNQMLSDTASNLKYLQNKYSDNNFIKNYINFTSGGMSLEEFHCRNKGITFKPESFESLFRFHPFDYINLKSR